MTGEKLPLLVIGRSENPRCFKHVKTLPVSYKANRKSWMTSVLFEEWLRVIDAMMKQQKRKIVMILDNCPAHPAVKGLHNTELIFLPPNSTSITQPMDGGVIRAFKQSYRKKLLIKRLAAFEAGQEFSFNLLDSLFLLRHSWDCVTPSLIANCFRHCGFGSMDEPGENEPLFEEEIVEVSNIFERMRILFQIPCAIEFPDYVRVDDELEVSNLLTDQQIIKCVMNKSDEEHIESEEADNADVNPTPSNKQVLRSLLLI